MPFISRSWLAIDPKPFARKDLQERGFRGKSAAKSENPQLPSGDARHDRRGQQPQGLSGRHHPPAIGFIGHDLACANKPVKQRNGQAGKT